MVSKLPIKPKGRDTLQNLNLQIELPRNAFYGALWDSKLVAVAIASHNGRKGWINRVAVSPEFQNQGIASKLIQSCEEFFKAESIKIFACLIEDWNEKSEKLFEKNGYAKYHEVSYYTKRLDPEF